MNLNLTGIHHLTAVTARARENYEFYTQTMGMRLVKKTVNQDDVRAYHLFYADGEATPGSDLTFFDWPHVPQERRGRQSITRTGLRVDSTTSLEFWQNRFNQLSIFHSGIVQRDGRPTLDFEDFEGQRLSLVAPASGEPVPAEGGPWSSSPVPAEHQVRGLGPITMTVGRLNPTDVILTRAMGMQPVRTYPDPESPLLPDGTRHTVHVFSMGAGGPAAELHVAVRPDLPLAGPGAGGVHHVAFRVTTPQEHEGWQEFLTSVGIPTSGIVERYYFRSIYFREPNGVLFELATDGPGFTVDEPLANLGNGLALPPFLEPRRADIEAHLKPLVV